MDVFITGIGIWCAVARGVDAFDTALREGRSGAKPVVRFDVEHPAYRTRSAASLIDEDLLVPATDETLVTDLAMYVAAAAVHDAGLEHFDLASETSGLTLGTSHGSNIAFTKFVHGRLGLPGGRLDPSLTLSATSTVAGQVAGRLGLTGPVQTISTACASGTNSIGRAAELIEKGSAQIMLAGGADIYTELSFSGFNILGATTKDVTRPLDAHRDGMMLGDGAAVFVLESREHARARGARAYARVVGHAISSEAYHATAPRPDGEGAFQVMEAALRDAELSPLQIDYINVHGTGTIANDEAELEGIHRLFGDRASAIPISGSKSMLGHTLGAAGSVELAATVLGVHGGYCPPTINLETPMVGYEAWTFVRDQALPHRVEFALSNSFGFAGTMASIVVGSV